jgi:hypothetical protein
MVMQFYDFFFAMQSMTAAVGMLYFFVTFGDNLLTQGRRRLKYIIQQIPFPFNMPDYGVTFAILVFLSCKFSPTR